MKEKHQKPPNTTILFAPPGWAQLNIYTDICIVFYGFEREYLIITPIECTRRLFTATTHKQWYCKEMIRGDLVKQNVMTRITFGRV
jgi:hypothetical protein